MAGVKLQGLPNRAELDAAALRRGGPKVGIKDFVPGGAGKETATLSLILDILEEGLAARPTKPGRKFDTGILRRALNALHCKGLPVTSGDKGIGPAWIAEKLQIPEATARSIARRLVALMPAQDKKVARHRVKIRPAGI